MPRPSHSRRVETTLSPTIWAARAARSTGQSARLGSTTPARLSTSTGPTECQASPTPTSTRVGCCSPRRSSGSPAEQDAQRHQQRDAALRQQEQHRHEHQLGGDRKAVAHREAHARSHRIGDRERHGQRRVELMPGREQRGHETGGDEEGRGGEPLDQELAARERLVVRVVVRLDQSLHSRREPSAQVLEDPHGVVAVSAAGRSRLMDGCSMDVHCG